MSLTAGMTLLLSLGTLVCGLGSSATDPNVAAMDAARQKADRLKQDIRMLGVSSMEPNQLGGAKTLEQMVRQIESLSVPNREQSPSGGGVSAVPEITIQSKASETAAAPAALPDIDTIENPVDAMALANALYRSGNYDRARRFYESLMGGAEAQSPVRQWAMYQVANCLRYQDKAKAIDQYKKLLSETPGSPWAPAAKAQQKCLEWLTQHEAELTLRTETHDPNQP